ncbi:MAG: hypothetical protein ABIS86_17145 [Streptosporangiaceae bacterium]
MSSTLLYLAIFVVWAIVLVPMWLHRDTETTGISRILHRRHLASDVSPDEETLHDVEDELPTEEDLVTTRSHPASAAVPAPARRGRRAAVIARRRRRTTGLTLLAITVGIIAATAGPWWISLPPVGLLTAHLALLRTATQIDQSRRHAARVARHEILLRARQEADQAVEEAQEAHDAEVIDLLSRTREVFDQYAAPGELRAVGD